MIELNHISKSYKEGAIKALHDITLSVNEGELFGLIGPDGSGKTSLFQIITTLRLADQGSAFVNGLDVVKDYPAIRAIIGYMPGKFSLYQDLTVKENLTFFSSIFRTTIESSQALINDIYVQLKPFEHRLAGQLSGGMKQKLALCCAMIHKPKVLFLDEPTTGVDAVSRREFWEMLKRLNGSGITIMVSTAYMDEAIQCQRIGLIQSGKLLSTDTPEGIINSFPDPLFAIRSNDIRKLLKDLRAYSKTKSCYASGEYLHATFLNDNPSEEVLALLQKLGHHSIEIKKSKPTVEDSFIQLMKS